MRTIVALALTLGCASAVAYPLDGLEYTGIKRLEYYRSIVTGELPGRTPVHVGARLPVHLVGPRLASAPPAIPFDEPDASLGKAIARSLGDKAQDYSISVLDLSDPQRPVYAEHNAHVRRNFGSVGKLLVATSWFRLLADTFPDVADRERVMYETVVFGDEFIHRDHHEVIIYDTEGRRAYRKIREGDSGSLWEWMDWMMSASNNSAAAIMQKQLLLLDEFGETYPPDKEAEAAFFEATSRSELGERYLKLMADLNLRNGIDNDLFRQGSFFTREGKKRVPGTNSYGNVRQVIKLLYSVERGNLVDVWTSREFKRLMYMTQKRIRYASHPALNEHAVYYKSGSLYSCQEEEGFVCKKYAGNKYNYLASVAIVEGPVGIPLHHYLVAVSSNVLRVNSAVAHQTLALRIHRLIEARHRAPDDGARAYPALPFAGARLIGEPEPEPEPASATESGSDADADSASDCADTTASCAKLEDAVKTPEADTVLPPAPARPESIDN